LLGRVGMVPCRLSVGGRRNRCRVARGTRGRFLVVLREGFTVELWVLILLSCSVGIFAAAIFGALAAALFGRDE
jgi:hypothetical protein